MQMLKWFFYALGVGSMYIGYIYTTQDTFLLSSLFIILGTLALLSGFITERENASFRGRVHET